MVRVLANGDIVADDDPRAQQATRRQSPYNSPQGPQQFRGNDQEYDNQQQGQSVNLFEALNQRLVAFGIPRWNIGDTVVEPIVSVGFLLALLMFGLPGVIFGAILFLVAKWSSNPDGAPEPVARIFGALGLRGGGTGTAGERRSRNPRSSAGSGNRLGR